MHQVRKCRNPLLIVLVVLVLLSLDSGMTPGQEKTQKSSETNPWLPTFAGDESVLSTTGSNRYFIIIMKPGSLLSQG
jgi:hypothetical protein